jgi:3-hydroxyisobutyrate dehydrogenase
MGAPMAARVARPGYDTAAFDIEPGRAQERAGDGVSAASTITQAATGADVLVLMLATPEQVEGVLLGDDPASAALESGATVGVMATVGPLRSSVGSSSSRHGTWSRWTRPSPAASSVRARETC